ncbi:hypothetical protein [Streptomyces sp. NBC_00582]|uniref:hypothetical protein n=1 Tax=Streptomyces sp. NBC_00582 TaxID=2975783 RepID=UPI002E80F44B|nr:hypothetical protein [Streptomyces sp. NBC_00582]WUB59717.1 hypothetical protein OG852_04565 [Streptomyces sp. NBC_00582]
MRRAAASAAEDVNQVVVAALLATVGDGVAAGVVDGAGAVGVGRGTAVAVSAGWGDRAGAPDGTGVAVGGGATDSGESEDTCPGLARSAVCVGCPGAVGGRELRVSVGAGRDVLEVCGVAVRVGGGTGVGRDRSWEADGAGRGVPSSDAASAQMPRPPPTRTTAAAPAIHRDLGGGRR